MHKSQILVITYKWLRKLAKSSKYQTLYSQYKESGAMIFRNTHNYTDYQIYFMQYLRFYSNLNMDVYMGDVDEIVLDNDIYEDSYSYYKSKVKNNKKNQAPPKQQQSYRAKPTRDELKSKSSTHILFSKPAIKK